MSDRVRSPVCTGKGRVDERLAREPIERQRSTMRQRSTYHLDPPWENAGIIVPPGVDARGMLAAAGLDWVVEKRLRKVFSAADDPESSGGAQPEYELCRLGSAGAWWLDDVEPNSDSGKQGPVQNTDAFVFFDPFIAEHRAQFELAGEWGDGALVWAVVSLPGRYELFPGEVCARWLIISNHHLQPRSVQLRLAVVRPHAGVSLMLPAPLGQPSLRIIPVGEFGATSGDTPDLIASAESSFVRHAQACREMALVSLDRAGIRRYLDQVFPPMSGRWRKRRRPACHEHIARLCEHWPGLQEPGVRGTLWAAYNAVALHADRAIHPGEWASDRLFRTWFGPSLQTKLRALAAAQELM